MTDEIPYESIPGYPPKVCAASILARLIDGLAFRFRWATDGLGKEEQGFKPSADGNCILELTKHIWGLVNWVNIAVSKKASERPAEFSLLRKSVLEMLLMMRGNILAMDESGLEKCKIENQPFWHMINGPFSDALTHVGQINSLRRLAGNPTPKANVFLGLPPE